MSKNDELMARRAAAVASGVASASPIFTVKGSNAEIWDADGRRFIDFAMGIAVCNTGHCHPEVMAAAKSQIDSFAHSSFQVLMYEPYIELAEKVNQLAPISNAKSVFFSTGAEAVENTVRIARIATGRPAVISFRGSFHGRTSLTATMTGKIAPYRAGTGMGAPNIFHAPFPVPHHGVSVADAMAGLQTIFKTDVDPFNVAAIVIEPVQGEGGFYQAPAEFMQYLRAQCDMHGMLLVCDEVQTGFARTGKMFATEHSGIEPDLMSIAKAMGSGYPISGVVGRSEVMDKVGPGGLGGTYGGNPIACAASLATIKVIEQEGLVARSNAIGERMVERITAMRDAPGSAPIGDIRGLGAMVAFEMVTEKDGNTPDPEATAKVIAAAREQGLILLSCGYWGNTVRLLAPLTVPDEHLDEALDMLQAAVQQIGAS